MLDTCGLSRGKTFLEARKLVKHSLEITRGCTSRKDLRAVGVDLWVFLLF